MTDRFPVGTRVEVFRRLGDPPLGRGYILSDPVREEPTVQSPYYVFMDGRERPGYHGPGFVRPLSLLEVIAEAAE